MQQLNEFWEQLVQALPFGAVAAVGASIQCLKGWRGWRNYALSVLSAGFGACVLGLAAQDMGITSGWGFFLAGMIGYSGGSLVDDMLKATTIRLDKVIGGKRREDD